MKTDSETNYKLQVRLVEKAMENIERQAGVTHQEHKGSDIKEYIITHNQDEFTLLESSWSAYLSRAVSDPANRIERTPGRYTYSLREEARQPPTDEDELDRAHIVPDDSKSKIYQQREAILYRPISAWLRSRGYSCKDSSASRGGGGWGNPDVTGIKVDEGLFGQKTIEIATVEVKLSSKQWRYNIFEAVAHKRFAHRVYFAFAVPEKEPSLMKISDAQELREYGEKYRIGIVVVFVNPDDYDCLCNGGVNGLNLDIDDVRVEELWPALFEEVSASAKTRFLREVLKISSDKDIYI